MQPNTLATIRRTLKARKTQVPTQEALLLCDAERLFLALLNGRDEDFSWFDVREWLRSYQLYRVTATGRTK